MTKNLKDIKLTTESFQEAGGLEVYPDFELIEPLGVKIPKKELTNDYYINFEILNAMMQKKAYERGFDGVFKIEYMDEPNRFFIFRGKPAEEAIGNGYRRKEI